jgi:hypothetical protein
MTGDIANPAWWSEECRTGRLCPRPKVSRGHSELAYRESVRHREHESGPPT